LHISSIVAFIFNLPVNVRRTVQPPILIKFYTQRLLNCKWPTSFQNGTCWWRNHAPFRDSLWSVD